MIPEIKRTPLNNSATLASKRAHLACRFPCNSKWHGTYFNKSWCLSPTSPAEKHKKCYPQNRWKICRFHIWNIWSGEELSGTVPVMPGTVFLFLIIFDYFFIARFPTLQETDTQTGWLFSVSCNYCNCNVRLNMHLSREGIWNRSPLKQDTATATLPNTCKELLLA